MWRWAPYAGPTLKWIRAGTLHGATTNVRSCMSYEAPKVVDHGTLVELTAGQADGDATDRAFPVNTPKRDLTFS